MSVLEKTIEKSVKQYAEKLGCITYKMNGPGHRGWPDRLFLRDGKVLFIEFKREGGKPTLLQAHIHAQLRKAGFTVVVIDTVVLGKRAVDALLEAAGDTTERVVPVSLSDKKQVEMWPHD